MLRYKRLQAYPTTRLAGATTSDGLAASIEAEIAGGRLAAGERLPTVRSLAGRLGLSPTTVAGAYRSLRERGLITTGGRRGTSVAAQPPLRVPQIPAAPAGVRDLWSGNPSPALLPPLRPALEQVDPRPAMYGSPARADALVSLAAADFAVDGIRGDIAIAGGALDAIERILGATVRPGDTVAVEDPTWPRLTDLLQAMGLRPGPVPMDDRGVIPAALERTLGRGARAVIVTPRGQNPTGATFDRRRQRELRAVLAGHRGLLLIEDDYLASVSGGEYHELHAATDRWATIRSHSKLLGPDLRVAPVCGDPLTVSRLEGRRLLGAGWVSHILQQTAAALWRDALDRGLLARAERVYGERRRALVDALATHGINAQGETGLGVWIPVGEELSVVQYLGERGWGVSPGERYRLASPPAIRVTTADLEPADAVRLAADFAEVLRRRPAA